MFKLLSDTLANMSHNIFSYSCVSENSKPFFKLKKNPAVFKQRGGGLTAKMQFFILRAPLGDTEGVASLVFRPMKNINNNLSLFIW